MKDIPGFEGQYAITKEGKLWSYPKAWISGFGRVCLHDGKFLSPGVHSGGYLTVRLGRGNNRFLHRLVAQAYIPNPKNLPEVNHKDTDKTNNHYSNLEWSTRRQNADHAKAHGLYKGPKNPSRGERHPDTWLTDNDVRFIRELHRDGWRVPQLRWVFPIGKTTMYQIVRRDTWAHL